MSRLGSDPAYSEVSSEEIAKERQEMWRKATALRKSLVTFCVEHVWNFRVLKTLVSTLVEVQKFKGEVGESHCIHFGSCALLGEDGGEAPWKEGVVLTPSMEAMTQAILATDKAADTAVVFDGGSIKARRKLEELYEASSWRDNREVTIVFESSNRCRGRAWKRVFGSDNVETGQVATNFRTNKWKALIREKYTFGKEGSSTEAVYAKVPVRDMAAIPTMRPTERVVMTQNDDCPSPVAGIFDVELRGHPFSWTERKPLGWYEVFLREVRAGLVVDYSPGSGMMATACLNLGIQYVGICRTIEHCSWLTNIINLAAVEVVSRTRRSPLYQQDLSDRINVHFKELIQALHQQHAAVAESDEECSPNCD